MGGRGSSSSKTKSGPNETSYMFLEIAKRSTSSVDFFDKFITLTANVPAGTKLYTGKMVDSYEFDKSTNTSKITKVEEYYERKDNNMFTWAYMGSKIEASSTGNVADRISRRRKKLHF